MEKTEARLPNGSRFPFYVHQEYDQFISKRIKSKGSWEPFETKILLSVLQKGDTVLDIGANIGWYSIVAGRAVGPTGKIFAFEPEKRNFALLQRNIGANLLQNVVPIECALSDTSGEVRLMRSATNLGDHRLAATQDETSDTIAIRAETLDEIVDREAIDASKIRIIKIDTQGAEIRVLRGARRVLDALPESCVFLVEFSPYMLSAHSPSAPGEFIDFVEASGRDVYAVSVRFRTIHPVTINELRRFADLVSPGHPDAGVDLVLAPRSVNLRRFQRFYAPVVRHFG